MGYQTLQNLENATAKMRERFTSEQHRQACLAARQYFSQSETEKQDSYHVTNSLHHFLPQNHIAHTTNFDKLVDLVVACGGESLRIFSEAAVKNPQYTSKVAVVESLDAIGTWVEEILLKRLRQVPFYSIMAGECTNVSTIEELSIYCGWIENGKATEHFIEIVPLKNAGAENLHFQLMDCFKKKNIPVSKLIGMGFDSAATFVGKRSARFVCSLLLPQTPTC